MLKKECKKKQKLSPKKEEDIKNKKTIEVIEYLLLFLVPFQAYFMINCGLNLNTNLTFSSAIEYTEETSKV